MGGEEPGVGIAGGGGPVTGEDPQPERVRAPITVEDLQRWEEHGATWRAVEISDERAVVELCTCYGEPVDLAQSASPELIAFVRTHRPD